MNLFRLRLDKRGLLMALSSGIFLSLAGCGNPSIDVIVKDLGEEDPNVPPGPLHRPGQPCVACHGPYYGASPRFSIAGTIFASETKKPNETTPVPVEGAVVYLIDTRGSTQTPTTNCAGNFWVNAEYAPQFPVAVQVQCPDPTTKAPVTTNTMQGRISREGSCNACHRGARNQSSPGWAICAFGSPGYPGRDKIPAECAGEIKPWWDPLNTGL